MSSRRHGKKPTIALWMLVAVADLAILVAATGLLTVLLILLALAVVAGGVFAVRSVRRPQPKPVEVIARRRA
jgi:MFS-type transporter involved in bile tolerance (Atg22 family)